MRKSDNEKVNGRSALSLAAGLAAAFGITMVIFLIYAVLLTYTKAGEEHLRIVAASVTGAAVIAGGFIAGRGVGSRGILWGMATGLLYAMIILGLNVALNGRAQFCAETAFLLGAALCGGGIGGVVGVNFGR